MNPRPAPDPDPSRRRWRSALVLLLLALAMGCDSRFATNDLFSAGDEDDTPGDPGGGGEKTIEVGPRPRFGGLESAVAESGALHLSWGPASDDEDAPEDIRFRVFVSESRRSQDFSSPALETEPGAREARLEGLTDGAPLFLVVRAVDGDGNLDANPIELLATPGRVVYVDAAAEGPTHDGASPDTAYLTINEGVFDAFFGGGGNVWIAAGDYAETLQIPGGVALYGGFGSEFDPGQRELSRIDGSAANDGIFTLVDPKDDPVVVDGLHFDGAGRAPFGILAADATLFLSRCRVQSTVSDGVQADGDAAQGRVMRLVMAHCRVEEAGSQGIDLQGAMDTDILDCDVLRCSNEGIQAEDLTVAPDGFSSIRIERCRVLSNVTDGIDIHFNEIDPLIGRTSLRGRELAAIHHNVIAGNLQQGLKLDIDYDPDDEIDGIAIVGYNEITGNGRGGVLFDGDASSLLVFHHNFISRNLEQGVFLSSDLGIANAFASNNVVFANQGTGFLAESGVVFVSAQDSVVWNRGAGFDATGTSSSAIDAVTATNFSSAAGAFELISSFSGELATESPSFGNVPETVQFATSGTTDSLLLPADHPIAEGDTIEIRDDGVERTVLAVTGGTVQFEPPLQAAPPAGAAVFGFGEDGIVTENFFPQSGSPLIDAGHPALQDPDGSPADLGTTGGPFATSFGVDLSRPAPGGLPFSIRSIEPLPFSLLPAGTPIVLQLTAAIDAATAEAAVFLAADGLPVTAGVQVDGSTLRISPPGDLVSGSRLVLIANSELLDASGRPLFTLLATHWTIQ